MSYYGVEKTIEALNEHGQSIHKAKVLILGLAYKKNVDDFRKSPSIKLIEILREKGAVVDYNDSYIPVIPSTTERAVKARFIPLTVKNIVKYDVVLIATDHSEYNPDFIAKHARFIVDTRNLMKDNLKCGKRIKKA